MATEFKSLPIVDLTPLHEAEPSVDALEELATQLYQVFTTVGFAYLVNPPLTYGHEQVFGMAKEFFNIEHEEKMKVAKTSFRSENKNTYRGFFPAQPGSDNLKEGLEIGPFKPVPLPKGNIKSPILLTEPNVFPPSYFYPSRPHVESLYDELQMLSSILLTLLARSLGKAPNAFTSLLEDSVSTLRMLHYPAIKPPAPQQELSCTPHTDSGLLTLLHQDATGGLEVLNAVGEWIPAPYVPGSLVVNIGDLMAQMSGGKFVATFHRVRSAGRERYSVPFFCEPGVDKLVGEEGKEVRYEQFVLSKMATWIEFQEVELEDDPAWGELAAPTSEPASLSVSA